MKQLHSAWVLAAGLHLLCVSSLWASSEEPAFNIIPKPSFLAASTGSFLIDAQTSVVANAQGKDAAAFLVRKLRNATGLELPLLANPPTGGSSWIVLRLNAPDAPVTGTDRESYRLSVTRDRIVISAAQPVGLSHGVQTLLQMLPSEIYATAPTHPPLGTLTVPHVEISDRPRFEWRGLMVDVSRHFFSKEQLKKTIDAMAVHKLNVLHLHLTDDPGWRIEIDQYPDLVNVGAIGDYSNPKGPGRLYFSKDDMREIIAYAARHHITVVPEIDMPGHAAAAARSYPQFFDGDKTFNPGNEATYDFVANVLTEIMDLFPSPYIHFGGDEVRNHRWDQLPEIRTLMEKHGYTSLRDVEGHFDRFVANYIVGQGRTPIGWDEIVEFGVNSETIVQWWLHLRPGALNRAVEKGHRVIISPTNYLYFDYPNDVGEPGAPWEGNDNGPNSFQLIHQWEPVPESFTRNQEALVLGLQANLWTEFITTNEYYEYMIFPRLSALAEIAWSPKGEKDLNDFTRRLKAQTRRYESMGLNYRKFGEWSVDFRYLAH